MRIIGQMVCGPGEADRFLRESLQDLAKLCDDAIIATCNATEKEIALIEEFDFRHYADNREWGRFQPYIKTDLLNRLNKLNPDWIIVLDADETLPTLDRQTFEAEAQGRDAMQFYVVNLWNDIEHYMRSMSFWNVRAYRPAAQPETQFLRKPVHCGNAPPYFYGVPAKESYVPHILLHRGLMLEAERLRRAERYALYDPNAIHKGRDYYDCLTAAGSGTIYDEQKVLTKLQNYVISIKGRIQSRKIGSD